VSKFRVGDEVKVTKQYTCDSECVQNGKVYKITYVYGEFERCKIKCDAHVNHSIDTKYLLPAHKNIEGEFTEVYE